eukprot:c37318_g1_i1 orf=3-248(-)
MKTGLKPLVDLFFLLQRIHGFHVLADLRRVKGTCKVATKTSFSRGRYECVMKLQFCLDRCINVKVRSKLNVTQILEALDQMR